jgi:hypothetical protein
LKFDIRMCVDNCAGIDKQGTERLCGISVTVGPPLVAQCSAV